MRTGTSKGFLGSRGRAAIALAAAVGLLGAAAIALALAFLRQAEPRAATILPEPIALPDFELDAADGGTLARDWFRGRPTLLFFGFTHCPDVCPITLQQLATVRRRLAADGREPLPSILFISVDPERDSAATVADYIEAFGEGVSGARGNLASLDGLTATLGAFHARPKTEDGYTVEHSAAVFVIDGAARLHALFGAPHDVGDMVHDWPIVAASM